MDRARVIAMECDLNPEFADQINAEAATHPDAFPCVQKSHIGPFEANPFTGEENGYKHYLRGALELRWISPIRSAE